MNDAHPPRPEPAIARPTLLPPVVLLRDLGGQLIWPVLLRVPASALWPSRLILGALAALLIALLGSLSRLWSDKPAFIAAAAESQATAWGRAIDSAIGGNVPAVASALRAAVIDSPLSLVTQYPVSTPILGVLMLGVLSAFGGAIARSVAVESATQRRPSAPAMLGYSLARWPSTVAAVLVPLAFAWLLVIAMRSLAWVTLGLPVLDVVGAILFPVQALLGLALVATVLGIGLAGPMVVPARLVEDSDAIDALQRPVAYLIARPLRVLLYIAVTAGVSALALGLARALVGGAWGVAVEQSGAWLSPARDATLTGAMPPAADGAAVAMPPTTRVAHWFIGLWANIPALLIGAYAISLFFTGATRAYLAARQVCDGQDPGDIQDAGTPTDPPPGLPA